MKSKQHLTIAIGKAMTPVGELYFEHDGDKQTSAFRYTEEWLENPISFAISPSLTLGYEWHFNAGYEETSRNSLPGPIADTSPDAWGRSLIERSVGKGLNEMDLPLAVNDRTRQGALRFTREDGVPLAQAMPPVPRMVDLTDMRRLAMDFDSGTGDINAVARSPRGVGDSLGGARPKSDVDVEGVFCIAKYTTARDEKAIERAEVATLNIAKSVGLRSSVAFLAMGDTKYPVAIIQRFDRDGDRRTAYISGQSFLNMRGNSTVVHYTDIVERMRKDCGSGEQTLREIRELYRRVGFTILVSNTDDHMKNHGFLHSGNGWVLSPAFDINPQPEIDRRMKTGISEISGSEASIEALIEATPLFELDRDHAKSEIFNMAKTMKDEWRGQCVNVGMSAEDIRYYEPAFNHPAMNKALEMGNTQVRIRWWHATL